MGRCIDECGNDYCHCAVFARFGLFPFMALAIALVIVGLLFAVFYKPRNMEGHLLFQEWRQFKETFRELDLDEWKSLSTDDKFRAYTYAIGCGDKSFEKLFAEFAEAENVQIMRVLDFSTIIPF